MAKQKKPTQNEINAMWDRCSRKFDADATEIFQAEVKKRFGVYEHILSEDSDCQEWVALVNALPGCLVLVDPNCEGEEWNLWFVWTHQTK